MTTILEMVLAYKYTAMFGILLLCGIGLPIPEEVTLLSSGLLVGWGEANFFLASFACCCGIMGGDAFIFGLGSYFGPTFLRRPPLSWLLTPNREEKVRKFFLRHGSKALFFARFVPGVRIGVYAYAGTQGTSWRRFLLLDGMGILISGPTSIWVGRWAGRAFAEDRDQAIVMAMQQAKKVSHWFFLALFVLLIILWFAPGFWRKRRVDLPKSMEKTNTLTKSS